MGQVVHALLTRPPLSFGKTRSIASYFTRQRQRSVRLACVRHAASVHPEPGSNSRNMIHSEQNSYAKNLLWELAHTCMLLSICVWRSQTPRKSIAFSRFALFVMGFRPFLKSSSVTDDVDLKISPKIRCRFFYLSSAFRHSAEYYYSVNKESTLVCLCFLLSKLHCCSVFKVPRTKLNAVFGECNAYLNILIL